mmetsp:Transcript_48305/g.145980  ORF Transcript_48305/g.145980 Transcript_48305/m.145980 type:complete len:89 (+) Transcript_48305:280-546(+)
MWKVKQSKDTYPITSKSYQQIRQSTMPNGEEVKDNFAPATCELKSALCSSPSFSPYRKGHHQITPSSGRIDDNYCAQKGDWRFTLSQT